MRCAHPRVSFNWLWSRPAVNWDLHCVGEGRDAACDYYLNLIRGWGGKGKRSFEAVNAFHSYTWISAPANIPREITTHMHTHTLRFNFSSKWSHNANRKLTAGKAMLGQVCSYYKNTYAPVQKTGPREQLSLPSRNTHWEGNRNF